MAANIIKDYFSENGIQFNLGRVPIGGSDFSTYPYSYDDYPDDKNLTKWSLTKEDFDYKVPFMKMAQNASMNFVKFFGSPWSVPAWMKTNNKLNESGTLALIPGGEYYQIWANYFVKFLDAYKHEGIKMWGITVQNEPGAGFVPNHKFNCLGFTAEMENTFIKQNLGPTLEKAGYGPNTTKLMIYDDQRDKIHIWADTILNDAETAKYVSGIAFHWYFNQIPNMAPPENLDKTHENHPDYFILATEACDELKNRNIEDGFLGSWALAEGYADDILVDLQHWTTGWVDWNLVLDTKEGPNWVDNFVDSPIIVNETANEYYKEPKFYTFGHFSKFLPPDSVKIHINQDKNYTDLKIVAFERPDNGTVLIALNLSDDPVNLIIADPQQDSKISSEMSAHSIQTYIWWN